MQVLLLMISNISYVVKVVIRNINAKKYLNRKWCEVWYEILQKKGMSPSHAIIYRKKDHHIDTDATYIFPTSSVTEADGTNPLRVMMERFLRELINRVVFTRMSKIKPNMSNQHRSRLSCSVYALVHVDLYQGLHTFMLWVWSVLFFQRCACSGKVGQIQLSFPTHIFLSLQKLHADNFFFYSHFFSMLKFLSIINAQLRAPLKS